MMNAENDYLTVSQPRDYAGAFAGKETSWETANAGGYFSGELGRHYGVNLDGQPLWQNTFNLTDTQKPLLAWYLDRVQEQARQARGSGRLRTYQATRHAGSWQALMRPDDLRDPAGGSHRIERREVS